MKTDENIIDENIDLQADGLTDLTVTEQQAEETKGGQLREQVTFTYVVTNTSPGV